MLDDAGLGQAAPKCDLCDVGKDELSREANPKVKSRRALKPRRLYRSSHVNAVGCTDSWVPKAQVQGLASQRSKPSRSGL
jgi:hypothetical protein